MTTDKLERIIKYNFNNVNLLKEALIHSSYSSRSCKNNKKNYERLEFLGDRVLGLVLAEYVFHVFPEANEGFLNSYYQKYVSQEYLFNYSKKIRLSNFIKTQKGDKLDDNKSILSDVVESIIGAIYLDSGFTDCKEFIIKEIIGEGVITSKPVRHPKTILQEYCLDKFKSLPKYKMLNKSGDDHNPVFTVSVNIENFETVCAKGRNLKSAEQSAALKLLEILRDEILK